MGFLRKATWVATGGASGLFIKANSKKERTARAAEKQVRLQQAELRVLERHAQQAPPVSFPTSPEEPTVARAREQLHHATLKMNALVQDSGSRRAESRKRAAELLPDARVQYEAARRTLDDAIAAADALTQTPQSRASLAGELERLQALREKGVLSEEEFQAAKRRVIED